MINGSPINGGAVNALPGGGTGPAPSAGSLHLPLQLTVTGLPSGHLQVPASVVALPVSLPLEAWDIRVRLAGVDVSSRLEGTIEIEAEEDAARVAIFTLAMQAGDRLGDFAGDVLIDVRPGGMGWVRRFTGSVAEPDFDLEARRVTLHAVDRRTALLAQSGRDALDAMLGGFWSAAVVDDSANSMQYAQALLATRDACFDLDVYGNPRLTPWASPGVDLVVTDDDLQDGSLRVMPVKLHEVVNVVTNDDLSLTSVSQTGICGLVHTSAEDTGASASDNITANAMPLIGGKVEANAGVVVRIAGQQLQTTAGSDGAFAVRPVLPLAAGVHTPHVTVSGSSEWSAWGTSFTVASAAEANAGAVSSAASEKVAGQSCSFEYRYPRLHAHRTAYQWTMGISYPQLVLGRNGYAYILPERQLFETAAGQTGWKLSSAAYISPLQGTQVVGWIDGAGVIHSGSDPSGDVREVLTFRNEYTGKPEADPRCESATLNLVKRTVQTVTERWRIHVSAPDSVAALGERKRQGQSAALDATGSFNANGWESSDKVEPIITGSVDLLTLAGAARADAEAALRYLAAVGRKQILQSHRANRIAFTLPANAVLDTRMRIKVDSADLLAAGKVARLVERYDLASGAALCEVELALSALIGLGTVDDDPLRSPAVTGASALAVTATQAVPSAWEGLGGLQDGSAWTTGATGDTASRYPRSVALVTPEVPAWLTDPIERELSWAVQVAIPVDPFELRYA